MKYKNALPAGRLIAIVTNYPNEIVTLDLLGLYHASRVRRNSYVLVITDHSSKWLEIVPLKKASAKVRADSLFNNHMSRYGAPIKMISDNCPQFISKICENLSNRLRIQHVKTVVYRPQLNRTDRVIQDLLRSYVNDNHETWDQFLREFAYALRTAVNETTGKTSAKLFLGRKLITPFQKLVMVSDGTEFAVGDIEKLFEEPKFEGPYRVLKVQNNNFIIWKAGKRLTVNIDEVPLYHQRKNDENVIRGGNLDSSVSGYQASSFESVRPGSDWSQNSKNNELGGRRDGPRNLRYKFVGQKRVGKRKRFRQAEASIPELDIGQYNLRLRVKKAAESRPSRGKMQDQGGPVRSRGRRFQESRPYNKDQRYKQQCTRQSCQEQEQERTIKPSESKKKQRSPTTTAPGDGRKINLQKDCVAGSPYWRVSNKKKY
ncbi:retrovirus-related Pol polyprotein from transposon 17.6 [Trichonephila clavipes]|uniref:Retrovirus-related Pol polyprotein from transposon 17.6 n=1 Tax=Trichonephila clavipes TaxID=2585209 RepID=A0A8X6RCX9_TRICX|nr:retrovirus-related Pol polyprotein from transposon 17.6 [Trichonephila clavipes]